MNTNIYISNHARQRIKERCGTGKKASAERMCCLAIERGINAEETRGSLRHWLDEQQYEENRIIYIYGDKAYIYSKDDGDLVLVTVLQLPAEIARIAIKNKKKRQSRKLGNLS